MKAGGSDLPTFHPWEQDRGQVHVLSCLYLPGIHYLKVEQILFAYLSTVLQSYVVTDEFKTIHIYLKEFFNLKRHVSTAYSG